ncbi:flagellar basal body rod protein FlgB [Lederbergia galactosidilytica]|uniref:Flagellar basal body rod protein FlgB n=1 Tax=Lederbergia galactosidilytica TaxID=217031 RepID=A0A177ZXI7_9BACI|nr:flagellar basal body rod protein FlgB [Lederbergia galactosidilytica]MBP1913662.1 flagellar basal-body rod protein FlgB [Lederbergia galactosidilytica]OAK72564.1 flagellar basal body rod protein FlgB [Lederbergia galactosidilytica]
MELFSSTITSLERGLGNSALKQKVIANNIANADVPNYKSKNVSFGNVLEDTQLELKRTDSRHLPLEQAGQSPTVYTKRNFQYHSNGNNVDLDQEMADMAKNQLYYQTLIERLNGNFSMLTNVLRGGK